MKAFVLNSGGVDSTTCVAMAIEKYGKENVITASLYYGQKHDKELQCARKIAEYYGVPHIEEDISNVMKYASNVCTLVKGGGNIEHASYAEQISEHGEGRVATYVPFRNGLFLSIATAYADSLFPGEEVEIYYGAHADDAAGSAYADCSPEFADAMDKAIEIGTYGKIHVCRPLINMNKAGVVKEGLRLKVPYELTWSCYEGGEKACGTCGTCIEENQRVLMSDNTYKSIKDIRVGDKIWAVDENNGSIISTTVTNVTYKGNRPVYDMNGLLLTGDHKVFGGASSHLKFREYRTMRRKDATYRVKTWPVSYIRATRDDVQFARGYLRGFVDGDGNISRGVFTCQKDKNILEEFWSLYNKYIEPCSVEVKYDDERDIYVASGGYAKAFIEKTTLDFNDKEFLKGYLNGFIIADGCASYNKSNHSFGIIITQSLESNKDKCENIDKILSSLNLKAVEWTGRSGGFKQNGSLMKNWKIKNPYLLSWVYGCEKKDKILREISLHNKMSQLGFGTVPKIGQPIKTAPVYDITTDAHTFICEGYVVHNCVDRLAAFHANGVEDPIEYESRS